MTRGAGFTVVIVVSISGGILLYHNAKSRIATGIYRQRLDELDRQYQSLQDRFNEAVRKTAVTELIVADGKLTVAVRTAQGVTRLIPTPFDPRGEVYVDYVVLDGRLWIRRVFDAKTPPSQGVVIDPRHQDIDWPTRESDVEPAHGKAVYRTLSEGRWVVTVTGDGSLGLAKAPGDLEVDLKSNPLVREYEPVEKQATARVEQIGAGDVIRFLLEK